LIKFYSPTPFSQQMELISHCSTEKETLLKACTPLKCFDRLSISRKAIIFFHHGDTVTRSILLLCLRVSVVNCLKQLPCIYSLSSGNHLSRLFPSGCFYQQQWMEEGCLARRSCRY